MGQRSILGEETTNLTATAINDMEVCFIPKSEIMADLEKNSNFSIEVLKQMAQDLKDSDNTIVNMAHRITSYNVCYTKLLRPLYNQT